MIYYVLLVAVLNLGLGFAVAVHRGRRFRRLLGEAAEGTASAPMPVGEAYPPESSADQEELGQAVDADPLDIASFAGELPHAEGEANVLAEPDCESASLEVSLQDLRAEVERYYQHVAQIDDQLRSCAEASDTAEFESCLNSLQAAGQGYLESREQAEEVFEGLQGGREEFAAAGDNLEVTIQRQTEQIRGTGDAIERFDYQADLEESCRQIVSETAKLMSVNHHVRDTLEEASVVVARNDQRLQSVGEAARSDPLTGLASRTGLEAELAAWWQQDPSQTRQLCMAMVDVDKFAEVNRRYGYSVGDRVLRALAQFLAAESREDITAARFSGQRFLMLFAGADVRATSSVIERIRQTVEIARLQYREDEIRITLSCAVTEATSEDTSETLCGRAETALREAKRYGRNRTFIHEGEYPAPVVPPSFPLKEKVIPV